MNRNIIILVLVAVLLAMGGVYYFVVSSQEESAELPSASYSDGTTTVEAVFNTVTNTVTFTHSSVGTVTLPQAISGSGARYANDDESIVFWEHQGEVTITKDGENVFQGRVN